MTIAHRISNTLLAVALTYALGVLMMVLAYARSGDYHPPVSEYFVVPLLMAELHPLLAGAMLALSLVLVHLCWTALSRQRAQSICDTSCLRLPAK